MSLEKEFKENWDSVREEQNKIDEDTDRKIWKGIERKIQKKKSSQMVYWAAAVLIPLFSLFFFYQSPKKGSSETEPKYVFQTFDKAKSIKLPDGSIIELKPNSKIILNKDFGAENRDVAFTGKGNFNITKDKTKPFRINAGDFKVQVLGTQFFLDQQSSEKKVELFEGKVKIENDQKITYLLPKEIWTNDQQSGEHHYFNKNKEKDFLFENENYSEAISQLENTYHIKISYPDQFKNKKVSGEFKGDFNQVLSVISFPFNLKPEIISEKEIILKIK
ncbi:FecR family protein [Chryseobacterium sp. JUb7]|uniref:FecR family protein n=1 Tax=Chryseobacterium sp. JUb7 TaxID=2940599 RepID=UPI0021695152|nr:FecR family protein [Chryseobacterium sp. JUb7]MCS3531349.1 ferric-dicitrate binding protein FerR (iron transport regulator) [Chryseobacterium sp. JUb7]